MCFIKKFVYFFWKNKETFFRVTVLQVLFNQSIIATKKLKKNIFEHKNSYYNKKSFYFFKFSFGGKIFYKNLNLFLNIKYFNNYIFEHIISKYFKVKHCFLLEK